MNPSTPREMQIGRTGEGTTLSSRRFPDIRGGVCEECGVIDNTKPGDVQYKFCKHYAGMDMKCSFCKETANHPDVVRQSTMVVREDPYSPGQLVTLCGSYECTRKFEQKYHINH